MTHQPTLFPDTETPDDRRAAFAARIGIDPERVHGVRIQLDVLRKQGILVDLNISGLSMFTRAASWMELGILDDDVRRGRFTRGQKFLIPEEQIKRLRSVESQMRQLLEEYSYRVTGLYPYSWVPFTAYAEFRSKWDELVRRFDALKAELLDNYDHFIDLLAADFTQVAAEAWGAISRRAAGRRPVVEVDGQTFADQEVFTDFILQRAMSRMPARERIEADLYADYTTALVYGDEDLAADELAASRIRRQSQAEAEQLRHESELNRLEENEKFIQLQAMRDAEAEHARRRLEQMVSPFEEVFTQLRARIAEDARAMLESIQKNGHVRGKVAEKGRGLLAIFDLMAVHSDYELRERLEQLKSAIGPIGADRPEASPDRDTAEIVSILDQVVNLSHTAAQDLLAGPSRFSMLDM